MSTIQKIKKLNFLNFNFHSRILEDNDERIHESVLTNGTFQIIYKN